MAINFAIFTMRISSIYLYVLFSPSRLSFTILWMMSWRSLFYKHSLPRKTPNILKPCVKKHFINLKWVHYSLIFNLNHLLLVLSFLKVFYQLHSTNLQSKKSFWLKKPFCIFSLCFAFRHLCIVGKHLSLLCTNYHQTISNWSVFFFYITISTYQ